MPGSGYGQALLTIASVSFLAAAFFIDGVRTDSMLLMAGITGFAAGFPALGRLWDRWQGRGSGTHPRPLTARPSREGELWWLGVAIPFGYGAWATFLYLAIRLRSRSAALAFCSNLAAVGVAVWLNIASGDQDNLEGTLSSVLLGVTWIASMVYAVAIRQRVRQALSPESGRSTDPPEESPRR